MLSILVLSTDFMLVRCPPESRPETPPEPKYGQFETLEAMAKRLMPWNPQFGVPDYLIDRMTEGIPAWQRYSAYVSAEYRQEKVTFKGWALPETIRDAPRHLQRFVQEDGAPSGPVRHFAHICFDQLFPMLALFENFDGFDYKKLKAGELIS